MQKQGYKDLIVWQKSMRLVKLVYDLCDKLPKFEQYILVKNKKIIYTVPAILMHPINL